MQDFNEEVLFSLNQVIENLCGRKLQYDKFEIKKNFLLSSTKKDSAEFKLNDLSNEILHNECRLFESSDKKDEEKIGTNTNFSDFKDSHAKTIPYHKFYSKQSHSFGFENNSHTLTKTEFQLRTSVPNIKFNSEPYFTGVETSLDETINEAIDQYEISPAREIKKLKNAFAQTTFDITETTDNQCQCDLLQTNILNRDPAEKRIKLNGYENSSLNYNETHTGFETLVLPPKNAKLLDDDGKYSGTYNKAKLHFKTASRVRIGLSKRFKHQPLHNISS